jgi:hypothetical protein
MATNPNDTRARKAIGKFARALLATTCLTVASGAAVAGTITYTEGNSPAPGTFSSTFGGASASALAAAAISGTTIVNGDLSGVGNFDYIELTGLGSGTFTVNVADTEGAAADASIFNSGHSSLGGPSPFSFSEPAVFASQAIPLDGDLVIAIESENEGGTSYQATVTTTAAAAPEPGTLATLGLGLAGAAALARRRRKQS